MNRCVVFFVGALAAMVSEVFWKGESRWPVALWGGAGMLLLRRIVLRFPSESRVLLCLFGALLLLALRLTAFLRAVRGAVRRLPLASNLLRLSAAFVAAAAGFLPAARLRRGKGKGRKERERTQ